MDGGMASIDVAKEIEDVSLNAAVVAAKSGPRADIDDGGKRGIPVKRDSACVYAICGNKFVLTGGNYVRSAETELPTYGIAMDNVALDGIVPPKEGRGGPDIAICKGVADLCGADLHIPREKERLTRGCLDAERGGKLRILRRRDVV